MHQKYIRYRKVYKLHYNTASYLLLATQTPHLRKHETIRLKKRLIKWISNLVQIITMHLNVKPWVVSNRWCVYSEEKTDLKVSELLLYCPTTIYRHCCFLSMLTSRQCKKKQAKQLEITIMGQLQITEVGHEWFLFNSQHSYPTWTCKWKSLQVTVSLFIPHKVTKLKTSYVLLLHSSLWS